MCARQYDVHIIAYTMLFRIVNKFHQDVFSDPNVPSGLNRSIDFRAVTLEHDRLLTNYRQEWAERFERDSDHTGACKALLLPLCRISRPLTFAIRFPVMVQMRPANSVSSFFHCTLIGHAPAFLPF